MKIALVGYGKMGKAIEAIALERGHDVVLKVGIENLEDFTLDNLRKADVAIEFTGPESAVRNIHTCFEAGLPVVCGSTGWLAHKPEVDAYCKEKEAAFLYASNFSLGVNIFFEVNKLLARLMSRHPEYQVRITEVHHTAKLDAPSGTAITLAEQILASHPTKNKWVNHATEAAGELEIESQRIDPAPGTHVITYASPIDDIEIRHTAHSRTGFALGAVVAAEFLQGKQGIFSMQDVLAL
jgi:4-hydroxy-tetrahydrodipicolinate reductase